MPRHIYLLLTLLVATAQSQLNVEGRNNERIDAISSTAHENNSTIGVSAAETEVTNGSIEGEDTQLSGSSADAEGRNNERGDAISSTAHENNSTIGESVS
nr:expressed protein [Hymenolepis microstoma]